MFIHTGKRTVIGSRHDADVSVSGSGVEPVHCAIENNNGVVTLHPVNGKTCVDGAPLNYPLRLVQGKSIKFTFAPVCVFHLKLIHSLGIHFKLIINSQTTKTISLSF